MALRVLIAGGGLGGLTLAHGLRSVGFEPAVFERGPADLDLSTSYRIHIDPDGSRALHSCIPNDLWHRFEAHSAAPPRGIAFVTERLDELIFVPEGGPVFDSVGHSHPISRSGLRQVLLTGLDDVVTFDKRAVGYEVASDHSLTLNFSDGTSARGDLLVGADGATSAIRKQLLPSAGIVDTGISGIAGKVYLNDRTRDLIGPRLLGQMTMVLPDSDFGLFMAPFRNGPNSSELDLPEHLFWVLIGRAAALGLASHAPSHEATQLRGIATRKVTGWHRLFQTLVAETDQASLLSVPLHTAQPVPAWPSSRVTLIGDAIHTMTPLQGLGGNTALRDAATLRHYLIQAQRGEMDLLSAIGTYEREMRAYGFAAVQQSLRISNSVASNNRLGRTAFRTVLRAANAMPLLKNLMFAQR